VDISLGGMALGAVWELKDNDTFLTLTGSGSTGLVTIGITTNFGDVDTPGECDLPWQDITITAGFPFDCADVDAEIYFDCDGFQHVEFSVSGITLLDGWLTLGAVLTFELQTKTLVLTPVLNLGTDVCFDIYYTVNTSAGPTIDSISFDGIGITSEISGVSFTGISYWGAAAGKPEALKTYWEMYSISTTNSECCGPLDFALSVFFTDTHTSLFDVAEFDASISYDMSNNFTFGIGFVYDVTAGLTTLDINFDVTW